MKFPIFSILLLTLFSTCAFGEGGKLSSPTITYRSDIDANRKEKIQEFLKFMEDDLTFIEGSFITQFSYQRFGGTSKQVSNLIGLLEGVGLWEILVQFFDFGEQETAFTLDQDSSKPYLRIIVNSGRKDFSLKDFSSFLPPPTLPDLVKPKAEQGGADQPATAPESKPENEEEPEPESEGRSR